jgi:CheY-like chemotaxis protein
VKFTQKGGRVEIRLEKANSYLDIIVKDTGKGIEPEFLPFVFDRFRQADQTSTRKHGGLGLGLAIVRQLVELHGGQVRVESGGEGLGTTFTVSLPLSPFKAQPAENEQIINPNSASDEKPFAESTELQGLQILVVDDEPDAQQLLEIVLSQCGAQVTVAASASEAIEQFKQNRFDLVITDIGMPEENGYSLIEKLRSFSSERGEKIPAVALTAYARSEDRIQALRSGFQMHIAKPIEPNELIAVVAALVNGNKS